MDQVLLARIQFGMTIGFHFLFPPISIGLAWLLVWLEAKAARNAEADVLSRLFGKVFTILYIVGIGSGIVMSLQFGTNWSRFTNFVSGVFGPILVAEVLIAFFLESIFFGIWIVGRGRVSERLRRVSILLVAIGATISAFWITAADSWMQTPAGYALSPDGSKAILTGFWAATFSPSALSRFSHVMMSATTITGFFVASVAAWLVLKRKGGSFAKSVLTAGVVIGLAGSVLVAGTGINEVMRLGGEQIEKVNVIRGIVDADDPAGSRDLDNAQAQAVGPGADQLSAASIAPAEAPLPPIKPTFYAFWTMAILGVCFGAFTIIMAIALAFKFLQRSRFLLWCLVVALPLPIIATELGWVTAEIGRQPWIVYKVLKTADSVSVSVSPGMLVFSLALIGLVYVVFLGVSAAMVAHEVRKVPVLPLEGETAKGGKA
jgi:cytochrome d ubiquinol oxidase subunit I